jgi:hypothetical protein
MLGLLADLRDTHGDHPFLLELVADYTEDDDDGRVVLYRQALNIASANDLPTFSILLTLARLLLEMGDPLAAMTELRAAEKLMLNLRVSEQRELNDLIKSCENAFANQP